MDEIKEKKKKTIDVEQITKDSEFLDSMKEQKNR